MSGTMRLFQCPYCLPFPSKTGKKTPFRIALYKVKYIPENILIFQCQKCASSFRVKMMGDILMWSDMSSAERKAFGRREEYHEVKITLDKGKEENIETVIESNESEDKIQDE